MNKKLKKRLYHFFISDQSGAALIWAVILLVVIITLSTSALFIGSQNLRETQTQEQRLKAYYISLSGIEIGYAALMATDLTPGPKYINRFTATKANVAYSYQIKDAGTLIGTANITIGNVTINGKRWIQITSVGSLGGTTTTSTNIMRIDPDNNSNIVRDNN